MMPAPAVSRLFKLIPAALLVAGISACMPSLKPDEKASQKAASSIRPLPTPERPLTESAASAEARAYFAAMQERMLSQGLLRTDGGGPDTPFTDRMLAENFIRIALYDEYHRKEGQFRQGDTKAMIRRWQEPVRLQVIFGASVPPERQATDRARLASYAARLSDLTQHPISLVEKGGNFILHVVSEDERQALAPLLLQDMPDLTPADVQDVTRMARSTYCMVYAQSQGNSGIYTRALAVVRAEHPDLLRQSCYHEEIAQGLGLANDSPYARPSIFNDDEEFALLTTMDEYLLKILYDRALKPGMKEPEARPIVHQIAYRLKG